MVMNGNYDRVATVENNASMQIYFIENVQNLCYYNGVL